MSTILCTGYSMSDLHSPSTSTIHCPGTGSVAKNQTQDQPVFILSLFYDTGSQVTIAPPHWREVTAYMATCSSVCRPVSVRPWWQCGRTGLSPCLVSAIASASPTPHTGSDVHWPPARTPGRHTVPGLQFYWIMFVFWVRAGRCKAVQCCKTEQKGCSMLTLIIFCQTPDFPPLVSDKSNLKHLLQVCFFSNRCF